MQALARLADLLSPPPYEDIDAYFKSTVGVLHTCMCVKQCVVAHTPHGVVGCAPALPLCSTVFAVHAVCARVRH